MPPSQLNVAKEIQSECPCKHEAHPVYQTWRHAALNWNLPFEVLDQGKIQHWCILPSMNGEESSILGQVHGRVATYRLWPPNWLPMVTRSEHLTWKAMQGAFKTPTLSLTRILGPILSGFQVIRLSPLGHRVNDASQDDASIRREMLQICWFTQAVTLVCLLLAIKIKIV